MIMLNLISRIFRKLYFISHRKKLVFHQDFRYVELFDQMANDYVFNEITKGKPLMVSKFGTVELDVLAGYRSSKQKKYSFNDVLDFIKCERITLNSVPSLDKLCSNAGFFPNDPSLIDRFYNIYVSSIKNIDILGSYIPVEKMFFSELKFAKKVNLYGYYFPFLYHNPWTKLLKGKKVLVIHPFKEEIEYQYSRRKEIWGEKVNDILPDFTLLTYKAVQSMGCGLDCTYSNWFDALDKMKLDIKKVDFDIAIIGCGAYGMPLASYVKDLGKISIHLAGCTQLLFGIIGKRWQDMEMFDEIINENWIHPFKESVPKIAKNIEHGCYW